MIDKSDTALKFPCQFPIKIMGKTDSEFETEIMSIFNEFVNDLTEDAFEIRPSKAGTYTAITATITATSKQQLDNIYQALTAHEKVLMAL